MKRNIPITVKSKKETDLIDKLNSNLNKQPYTAPKCECRPINEPIVAIDVAADCPDTTVKQTYARDPKTGRFCHIHDTIIKPESTTTDLRKDIIKSYNPNTTFEIELSPERIKEIENEYITEKKFDIRRKLSNNARKYIPLNDTFPDNPEDSIKSRESVEDDSINDNVLKATKNFTKTTLEPAIRKIEQAKANLKQTQEQVLKHITTDIDTQSRTHNNHIPTGDTNTVTTDSNNNSNYEYVNHPSHYNSSSIETIEKMRRIYGNKQTALWCEMTAFKYRDRIGNKPNNANDQEVAKIKWYEAKAKELLNIID